MYYSFKNFLNKEELDIINAQHISSNNHLPLNNSNMYSIQNSHSAYMNSSNLDNYPGLIRKLYAKR